VPSSTRPRRRIQLPTASAAASVGLYLLLVCLMLALALNGAEAMGYNWQWYRVPEYLFAFTDDGFQWGGIALGLVATLKLSLQSFLLAVGLGAIVAWLRMSKLVVGNAIAVVFLEIVRNLPLLILLYLFYYVLGPIFALDRYAAAVLCLGVYHAALVSEILRAGVDSIDGGQLEAARSVGMSNAQAHRHIVLPQAMKFLLPPMTGEAAHLIKSSAIVSVIAVVEMTTVGRNIIADTYMSFEIWFTIAAVYLLAILVLSLAASRMEQRYAIAGRTK